MSPRPRRNSDLEILYATFRAIARLGPSRLTLADVAREAQVSPASLVQRFGSKRALLLAAAADAAGGHEFIFEGLRARHASVSAALLGLAECMRMLGETPDEVAHSMAFLQLDSTDEAFRAHARRRSHGMRAGLAALIEEGIAAGEFADLDATRLARALLATLNGSILEWTIVREGTMAAWVRRDLRSVLAPYLVPPPTPTRRRSTGRAAPQSVRTTRVLERSSKAR